jgi:cytochrome c
MNVASTARAGLAAATIASPLLFMTPAGAQSPAAQRGLVFVRAHCAQCHAIDKMSPSPLAAAPPFRTLHRKYPVESLEEALAEGIVTGHPSMPEFRLDLGQVNDVITFFKTLE